MSARTWCIALLLCSCASRAAPPSADAPERPFPDMSGRTIMLLPIQPATPTVALPSGAVGAPRALTSDGRAMLEAELSFWLPEAAPRIRWVLPAAIEARAERSPTLDVRVRDLPVQDFLRARLQSVGDPLYGDLRKLALLMDVRPALIPIGAVWVPEAAGNGRVHLALALVDTTGGAVIWYGVVAGVAGARADAATIASTAQALARLAAR
jgi:hypothetical protein